ncbi:TPA: phosphopentomutase [bacterium]|nr:phosphopentomutase [bacterium]
MYKRIFLIVLDSLGVGAANDAHLYGDEGSDTLGSVLNARSNFNLENLTSLGLLNLASEKKFHQQDYKGVIAYLNETSKGKDTLTGHYEMMGLEVQKPFKTFTDTGFPSELINTLEEKWGRGILGNISASGTKIIEDLGEEHISTGKAIVYTSADSVLQIAAHEEVIPLDELYRMCEIAREVTLNEEWKVARIIARPFIGEKSNSFTRTSNRKDYALDPFNKTYLDNLSNNDLSVIGIGKIADIFNNKGITKAIKTKSNADGMDKTIEIVRNEDFKGLCFVNLVDFDSKYGHRRDALGYLESLEEVDIKLGTMLHYMKDNDLLIICADHGNDPGFKGSDHTREKVPFVAYSKNIKGGRMLEEQDNFACIGASIMENFKVEKDDHQIGKSILNEIID